LKRRATTGRLVAEAGLPAPACGGLIDVDGRTGIIYERLEGQTLLEAVRRRPYRLIPLARLFAALQRQLHRTEITGAGPGKVLHFRLLRRMAMADQSDVRPVRQNELDRLAATLTLAFSSDPSARWAMPDASRYLDVFMPLVGAFGAKTAIERETAHVVGDFQGAAIWLPPGVGPDEEAMGAIFARHIEESHLAAVYALFEKMAGYHPQEPHWYLPLIGVDPSCQRRGLGAALLRYGLAVCDQEASPAYLEATSPANVPLYERHGFEVMGEIVVGGSPPMFPMVRRPR
jgi:ribosomal protein S18 acetylase RimI-like enzyme